ncbi:molecular chaperone SurA [Aureimonas sp. SA4125]|nr:molecular chaperone SurA [Aureimonas sp. SA4125]
MGVLATGPALAASEIKVIVNKEPVTTFAIRQRAAFLKLRRVKGDLTKAATEELIDEALKKQETRRRNITIPDQAVEQSFQKFAADNKLTGAQLSQIFGQVGFSEKAFKEYIRVQMGWGQAVQSSVRGGDGRVTEQDAVQRMLAQGGTKPSTTEYTLQQVIFVIPEAKRGAMKADRMREAAAMRSRFRSCQENYEFAKGLRDVTVRELGRVPLLALPERWKDGIVKAGNSGTTPPQETERGVEYIVVCGSRTISDDKTAAMVFQSQDLEKIGKSEPDAKLLKELRDKATIIKR